MCMLQGSNQYNPTPTKNTMPYIEGIENERRWVKVFDSIGPGTIISFYRGTTETTYMLLSKPTYHEITVFQEWKEWADSDEKEVRVFFRCWNLTKCRKQVLQCTITDDGCLSEEDLIHLLKIRFAECFLVDGFVQTLDAQ